MPVLVKKFNLFARQKAPDALILVTRRVLRPLIPMNLLVPNLL